MNIRKFAQQQRQARIGQNITPTEPNGTAPTQDSNPIATAQKIIAEYKISHEIAEGCRLQILQDLERKENPYKLLLYAAAAISRLDYKGDTFFLQVKNKIIEVYGRDISEDSTETE